MMSKTIFSETLTKLFVVIFYLTSVESARILGVYPTPSISHQVVFRAVTLELVKRGHEVVVITPNPAFEKQESPRNLTEIDFSDAYFKLNSILLGEGFTNYMSRGAITDAALYIKLHKILLDIVDHLFDLSEVKEMIKNDKFDLVMMEGLSYTPLIFGKMFDAPVILFSSLYGTGSNYEAIGAVARHPLLHPCIFRDNFNGGFINKIKQLYSEYLYWEFDRKNEQLDNDFLKSKFGADTPTLAELKKNIALLFVNSHPIFDGNRPVPPSAVYLGATHLQPIKDMPQDLKTYLDRSTRGVVYVSLGTNVKPSMMDKEFLTAFLDAFEKIPYDILWKFDDESLNRIPENVRIQKWFPQRDLLNHTNIKLFVTQGGLQSTDEAIDTGVPLVGIPFLADQWYNANKYVELGIGVAIDSFTMTSEDLIKAVNTVINDVSYKENIIKLKVIMRDQPESSVERAIWWTEHVLRHKNSRHLRGPAAQMSWSDYLMLDVLIPLGIGLIGLVAVTIFSIILTLRLILGKNNVKFKQQ